MLEKAEVEEGEEDCWGCSSDSSDSVVRLPELSILVVCEIVIMITDHSLRPRFDQIRIFMLPTFFFFFQELRERKATHDKLPMVSRGGPMYP